MKVGQFPPWSIEPPLMLRKALGSHLEHYKKGLANESIAYGIGAYAYYRRVVEDVIASLLDQIADLIPENDKQAFQQAMQKARKEHVAERKIQLVRHLLPDSLRIEGVNPLDAIYTGLSEGLHAKSDEECLTIADALRAGLTHLIEEIQREKQRKADFTASMRRILNRNWGQDTPGST